MYRCGLMSAVIKLNREPLWRSALYTVNVNLIYIASYETLKYILRKQCSCNFREKIPGFL